MDVLKRIRTLMDQYGWSEYKLAEKAGMESSTLNVMFHRKSIPQVPTLEKITAAFGITMAQFFSEEGAPVVLTPEQQRALDAWNVLSPEQKDAILLLMLDLNHPKK